MKELNALLLDTDTEIAASQNTAAANVGQIDTIDITATIADVTPDDQTFDSGTEVQTITFPAKASATDGDYVLFYDAEDNSWGAALDTTGGAAQEPTGAFWLLTDAGKKTYVDISGATTAAQVAAAVETALAALTGFSDAFTTDDTAADGTMLLIADAPGNASAPLAATYDDGGAGSITVTTTVGGGTSDVALAANTATVTGHGMVTGLKVQLTTDGVLPAGLSTLTDYYIIAVDDDTVKFATSQANALAGTAVDVTDYGYGTHTIAVEETLAGSIKLQKNNEPEDKDAIWFDIATPASQNITTAGDLNFVMSDIGFRQVRAVVTVTEGQITAKVRINGKGS